APAEAPSRGHFEPRHSAIGALVLTGSRTHFCSFIGGSSLDTIVDAMQSHRLHVVPAKTFLRLGRPLLGLTLAAALFGCNAILGVPPGGGGDSGGGGGSGGASSTRPSGRGGDPSGGGGAVAVTSTTHASATSTSGASSTGGAGVGAEAGTGGIPFGGGGAG